MAPPNLSKKVMAPPSKKDVNVPFKYLGAMKSLKPQFAPGKRRRYVSRSIGLKPTRVAQFICNSLHVIDDDDVLSYLKDGNLVLLTPEEVKDLVLNPWTHNTVKNILVTIKKDGSIVPGFLPDLANFALLPKPFKVVPLMMFQNSGNETPPLLKNLWLSTSPTIPLTINQTRLSLGLVSWSCFSFPSRVQLVKVNNAASTDIELVVDCDDVSDCPVDGRKYEAEVKVYQKLSTDLTESYRGNTYSVLDGDLNILLWNCRGIGRPSFLGNVQQLIRAH